MLGPMWLIKINCCQNQSSDKETLIYSICQFPWCKNFHHGRAQPTSKIPKNITISSGEPIHGDFSTPLHISFQFILPNSLLYML